MPKVENCKITSVVTKADVAYRLMVLNGGLVHVFLRCILDTTCFRNSELAIQSFGSM